MRQLINRSIRHKTLVIILLTTTVALLVSAVPLLLYEARAYRDFLPGAPEELGAFVGLKTVPSMDPFPREAWGKRACAIIGAFN